MERQAILTSAAELARGQAGGTLATTHAEDGTPYVTFVLAHLMRDGRLLFGSAMRTQHARNILATPEASFLFDNREAIASDWTAFDRVVVEGTAHLIPAESGEYEPLLGELGKKSPMAAFFTRHGALFCLAPRRLLFMKGLEGTRHTVQFPED